jgi:hypothetical protein
MLDVEAERDAIEATNPVPVTSRAETFKALLREASSCVKRSRLEAEARSGDWFPPVTSRKRLGLWRSPEGSETLSFPG